MYASVPVLFSLGRDPCVEDELMMNLRDVWLPVERKMEKARESSEVEVNGRCRR